MGIHIFVAICPNIIITAIFVFPGQEHIQMHSLVDYKPPQGQIIVIGS